MDLSLLARKIETGVELVDSYTFNILHFGISYGREKFCSTGPRTCHFSINFSKIIWSPEQATKRRPIRSCK